MKTAAGFDDVGQALADEVLKQLAPATEEADRAEAGGAAHKLVRLADGLISAIRQDGGISPEYHNRLRVSKRQMRR